MRRAAARLAALVVLTLFAVIALAASAFAVDPALRKKAKDADSFKRSDAARELGADGSKDAVKLLVELIADRNPYVRDAAVEACEKVRADDAIAVLAKRASAKDEFERRNVADALGRTKSPSALAALGGLALGDRLASVRVAALDALWGFREDAAAHAISAQAVKDSDASVRAAASEAAGRIRAPAAIEVVEATLADADEGVRCVARMELRYVDRAAASKRLHEVVGAPGWRMRAQVVEDALFLRDAPSLDALVALVGDEHPRVAAGAHRALRMLTGKELGRDADLWRAWWQQNREGWSAPEGRLDHPQDADDPKRTQARYHGVGVTGRRIVFVVDLSGSMRDELDGSGGTRWDAARAELEQTLDALPADVAANVVLFQAEVSPAFDAPRSLDAKTRKALKKFLRRTSPGEGGNLLAGVVHALGQDDVDSVYLLSDGAPSAGDSVRKGRVRAAIRQTNRTLKRAIHCIGFGAKKASERSFLGGVSSDSGGVAVFR